ncbi:serine hydrolase domain-containing protein [Paenibacillus silvisoli]|uniref:serine hydrolase domain-containing protein n=1 Tax=Paenibacillus silvisoli TaxID=3110539 RepID=UPI002805EB9A|nr:serine hydrolase [Paenibacillus silvisoli]
MMSENRLPRSTPEEQGVSSGAILDFLNGIRDNGWEVHDFMLLRHGHVVAEGWWAPYRSDIPHALYSMSKSIVSTAIGFAVSEGLLSLDDRIVELFPEDVPEIVSENLSAMTIRHLLMMATGHAVNVPTWTCESGNWVRLFLETPVEHQPGTHFVYNTCATYVLCAAILRKCGQSIDEYLNERLFRPLGWSDVKWDRCPRGIAYAGLRFTLTSEEVAKLGQLYLQRGHWNGSQLLPASWIDEATAYQIANGNEEDNDFTQGYGYQFWRCRHNTYRADGAFGQFCLVMPEQDAVLAVFSGTDAKEDLVNSIWGTLLPGISYEKLPPNERTYTEFTERLNNLRLDICLDGIASAFESQIHGRAYELEPNRERNESLAFLFDDHAAELVIRNNYGEQSVGVGRHSWQKSHLRVTEPGEGMAMVIAGCFRWSGDRTLEVHLVFVETSFSHRYVFRFEEGRLELAMSSNLVWDWLTNDVLVIHGHIR